MKRPGVWMREGLRWVALALALALAPWPGRVAWAGPSSGTVTAIPVMPPALPDMPPASLYNVARVSFDAGAADPNFSLFTLDTSGLATDKGLFSTAGALSYPDSGGDPGFAGRYLRVDSGFDLSLATSTVKLSFLSRQVDLLSFLWSANPARGDNSVVIALSQGPEVVLKNCSSPADPQCVLPQVPGSLLEILLGVVLDLLNPILDLLGLADTTLRITYTPPPGVFIESVSFTSRQTTTLLVLSTANAIKVDDLHVRRLDAPMPLDHLEISTASASGLSCVPNAFTVKACIDASCSQRHTQGVSGTLGIGALRLPFSLPAGSSQTVLSQQVPVVGDNAVSLVALDPVTRSALAPLGRTLYCGFGVAPSSASAAACQFKVEGVGIVLRGDPAEPADLNLQAGVDRRFWVSVVKANQADPKVCQPAFVNESGKAFRFSFAYVNPASPAPDDARVLAVRRVGDGARSVVPVETNPGSPCPATGVTLNPRFGADGWAPLEAFYDDAGKVSLKVQHTLTTPAGQAGQSLCGFQGFAVRPHHYAVVGLPAGKLVAGEAYTARVLALPLDGTRVTANLGRESPANDLSITLSSVPISPVVLPAVAQRVGTFAALGGTLGAVSAGVATVSVPTAFYDDVGPVVVSASSQTFLGHAQTVSDDGSATATFVPKYLKTEVTQSCGSFTYADQPVTVKVTAMNAKNEVTRSYVKGSGHAQDVLLSVPDVALSLSPNPTLVGREQFVSGGAAVVADLPVGFATFLTAPTLGAFRATERLDPQVSSQVPPAGRAPPQQEGAVALRRGRLSLSDGLGRETSSVPLGLRLEHWSGRAWVLNADDVCTSGRLGLGAVVRSGFRNFRGDPVPPFGAAPSAAPVFLAGVASLEFPALPAATSGSLDVAINLGRSAADSACLNRVPPASVGAGLPWLRGGYGTCAKALAHQADPVARIDYGIHMPPAAGKIHAREDF